MKTLKFIHGLADDIRHGFKNTTWLIDDDQDLVINDQIRLIDMVDKNDPASWVPIGVAKVEAIVQKRLRDITAQDMQGHRSFSSQEEMLRAYRGHGLSDVNLDTPVKIIHFRLLDTEGMSKDDVIRSSIITEVKLYADGGSRGNPGPSASGYVLFDMEDQLIVKKGIYLGITTNNQAEYQALKFGLEECQYIGARTIHVFMDSMLVINQMRGKFKIKNRDLWPIHKDIEGLLKNFRRVTFVQVPRELNKAADRVVNETLDAA